jgi:acyl phosphate:glycerol-3-phosphate acyltransferase
MEAASAWLPYATAFAAAVGHVWPLWHGFRGGKGAATVLGGILVLWPAVILPLLVLWLLVLMLSGYVGLSTILAAVAFAAAAALPPVGASSVRMVYALSVALLVLYAHRGNLARLRAGTESRFDKARLLHRLVRRA